MPGGQLPNRRAGQAQRPLTSVRVGDLDRAERAVRAQRTYRRHLIGIGIAAACAVALLAGGIALYYSDAFSIERVSVQGVEHLTASEMEQLAGVPAGTTLLRVDADAIRSRLLMDAWVQDVSANRVFPDTLEIVVTERTITAVVDVSTENASSTQAWAIASDGMWLMPIPAQDSEAGRNTSPKVYEDAASALHIADVPYGVEPKVGSYCVHRRQRPERPFHRRRHDDRSRRARDHGKSNRDRVDHARARQRRRDCLWRGEGYSR